MRGAEGATTAARMGRDGRPQGEAETDDRDWRCDGGRAGADGDGLLLLKKVRPRIRDGRTAEARRRLLLLLQLDD